MNWILFWLCFHILAVVVGFGPTFAYPFIGAMAQQEPPHVPFALRLQERIGIRLILPAVGVIGVSGIALLLASNINLIKTPYLLVALILYLTVYGIGYFVLTRNGTKLLKMVEAQPPVPMSPAGGPAPEFLALIRQQQVFGAVNLVLIVTIVLLMIIKPGGIVNGPLFG